MYLKKNLSKKELNMWAEHLLPDDDAIYINKTLSQLKRTHRADSSDSVEKIKLSLVDFVSPSSTYLSPVIFSSPSHDEMMMMLLFEFYKRAERSRHTKKNEISIEQTAVCRPLEINSWFYAGSFFELKRWCDNDDVSEALRHKKKIECIVHCHWHSSGILCWRCCMTCDKVHTAAKKLSHFVRYEWISQIFLSFNSNGEQSRRHIKGILSSFKHTCMINFFLNNIDDDTSFLRSLFCSSAPVVMHTTRRRAPADAAPIGLRNDKNVTFSRKNKRGKNGAIYKGETRCDVVPFAATRHQLCHCVREYWRRAKKKSIENSLMLNATKYINFMYVFICGTRASTTQQQHKMFWCEMWKEKKWKLSSGEEEA